VLIDNVLEASETDISRIMTPSPRIDFLDASLPVPELLNLFRQYRHPRIPVFKGHWDNVIGFLHSEDMLRLTRGGKDLATATLDSIIKPAHFVPPTKKVDEMFDYFQRYNTRVAIILGEFGEVLGIVTMKDVVKFIFGEISGRMVEQDYYKSQDDSSYIVPGEMRLSDFYNLTNFDIPDPVMTTVGGVAFRLFDSLPKVGDRVTYSEYEFIAQEVKGLRISKVQVGKITSRDHTKQEETALPTPETESEPEQDTPQHREAEAEGVADYPTEQPSAEVIDMEPVLQAGAPTEEKVARTRSHDRGIE
jgi:CBS domain containing-hemolysin-like protein